MYRLAEEAVRSVRYQKIMAAEANERILVIIELNRRVVAFSISYELVTRIREAFADILQCIVLQLVPGGGWGVDRQCPPPPFLLWPPFSPPPGRLGLAGPASVLGEG